MKNKLINIIMAVILFIITLSSFIGEDVQADANIEFDEDIAYYLTVKDLIIHNVTFAAWLYTPSDDLIDTDFANGTGDVVFNDVYLYETGSWYVIDGGFNYAYMEVYLPGEGDWYNYTNTTVDNGRVWIDDIIKGSNNNALNFLTEDVDDNATARFNLTSMSIPDDNETLVVLSYDLYVPNATVDAPLWFPIWGNDTDNYLFTVSPYIIDLVIDWYCVFLTDNGSGSTIPMENETAVTLEMDFSTWYDVTIIMNLSSDSYRVQITNQDTLESMTSIDYDFAVPATNITAFGFEDNESYTLYPDENYVLFAIDNIWFYNGENTYYEYFSLNFPPSIISPSPANGSVDVDYDLDEVSVYIYDPDGDWFNWTIEMNNSDSSYGNYGHNGTKKCLLSDPLALNTTYTFWVNITDYTGSTQPLNRTIVFTLEPYNGPPNISNPVPANNSERISSMLPYWSCDISDPEGDTFNYTIDVDGNIKTVGYNVGNGTYNVTFDSQHSYRHEYTIIVNITDYTATEEPVNRTYYFKIASDPGDPWTSVTEGFRGIAGIVFLFIFLGVSLFLVGVFGRR